jgi:hypothetical protein
LGRAYSRILKYVNIAGQSQYKVEIWRSENACISNLERPFVSSRNINHFHAAPL